MARESGRGMRLYIGLEEGGAPQLVPYMSGYSIEGDVAKLEVTAGGDGNKTYVVDLPDFSGTINGFADGGLAVAEDPLWLASRDGRPRHFRLYPNMSDDNAATDATVSNKALTDNVATITTAAPHGFAVGMAVTVASVGAPFDGTYIITAVPSSTTFSYAKVNANVASAVATGTATGPNTTEHYFGQAYFSRSEAGAVAGARTITSNITASETIYRTP